MVYIHYIYIVYAKLVTLFRFYFYYIEPLQANDLEITTSSEDQQTFVCEFSNCFSVSRDLSLSSTHHIPVKCSYKTNTKTKYFMLVFSHSTTNQD